MRTLLCLSFCSVMWHHVLLMASHEVTFIKEWDFYQHFVLLWVLLDPSENHPFSTSQQMWHVSPLKSSHHYGPLSVSLTPAQRQPFTSSPLTPSKSLVWDLFHCSISAAFLDSWALPDAQSYSSIASNIGVITLIGYPGAGASLQGSESHETCSIRNRSTFWLLINGLSIHHRQLVCVIPLTWCKCFPESLVVRQALSGLGTVGDESHSSGSVLVLKFCYLVGREVLWLAV